MVQTETLILCLSVSCLDDVALLKDTHMVLESQSRVPVNQIKCGRYPNDLPIVYFSQS